MPSVHDTIPEPIAAPPSPFDTAALPRPSAAPWRPAPQPAPPNSPPAQAAVPQVAVPQVAIPSAAVPAVALPAVAIPDDAPEDGAPEHPSIARARVEFWTSYFAATTAFNTKAVEFVHELTAGDTTSAKARRLLLAAMPLATLLVGAAVMMTSLTQDEPWVATGAGAATVALVGILLFLNPLKTVERDMVYRRWSDLIMASYFMRAGNYRAELRDLDHAARDADASFALLAASFQKDSAQTLEAVAAALGSRPGEGDDAAQAPPKASGGAAKAISLTCPDDVESVAGQPIAPVTVDASGPPDLVLAASGQPEGITFAEGRFTGTPTEPVNDARVTVSATSRAGGKERRVFASFHWTVAERSA